MWWNKKKGKKVFKVEFVKQENEETEARLMRKESEGLLTSAPSEYSVFPFVNKIIEKRIAGIRRVVKGKIELAHDLVGLEKAKQRLRDVDIEIDKEHIERLKDLQEAQNRLLDAQREAMLNEQKDEIARLKLEVEKAEIELKKVELKKKMEELGKVEPPPQKPRPRTQPDKINERSEKEKAVRETIAKNREKELRETEERAEKEGLSPEKLEEKKKLVMGHWERIKMEELQKIEREFEYK